MAMKDDLFDKVTGDAGVTAIIVKRFFPDSAPAGTEFPYATYFEVADPGHHHMGGNSDIRSPEMQIDCWGRTSTEAASVAEAIKNVIDGKSFIEGGTNFRAVFKENELDFLEERKDGSDEFNYRRMLQFDIWYV